MDNEDFFSDSLHLIGGNKVPDSDVISYGPLKISIAPKVSFIFAPEPDLTNKQEGKACSLLADQLFSPSLALAEMIEQGKVAMAGKSWIELGAGTGLVSLISATSRDPPRLIVMTDYPDQVILANLRSNIENNQILFTEGCQVAIEGYEWGKAVEHIKLIQDGFDILIMSDLLYFDKSHDDLVQSIGHLLARNNAARVYVGAGKYTPTQVCDSFLEKGRNIGLLWTEKSIEGRWQGTTTDATYSVEDLEARKNNSRVWIGQWSTYPKD